MAEHYMKTAEFAAFCGITKDTLFWYDRQGILKPVIVGENGYRYYSPRQFFDYSTIATLRQAGNSLKDIASFQQEHSYSRLLELFSEKSAELDEQIQVLTRMKHLVDTIQENLLMAQNTSFDTPELVHQEEEYLSTTEIPEGFGWYEKDPEEYIYNHIHRHRNVAGINEYPLGTILSSASLDSDTPEEIAYFYTAQKGSVPNLAIKPKGTYVRIFHKGYYGNITDTLKIAADHIKKNGLKSCGPIYEYDCLTYLLDSDEDSIQMLLIPVSV